MSIPGESRKHVLAVCIAAALAMPVVALADQSAAKPATSTTAAAKPAEAGKGVSATDTVEKRATITKIDAATRTMTLKGEQGEFDVEVSPEVKNFDKLKVGDVVAATYTQSIAARIAAPGEATPGIKENMSASPVANGQATAGHEVTASLKVEAIDLKANTVTLGAGDGRTRTVEVKNPKVQERLKTMKPGDMVVVTYTESLALRLEKVAPK